MTDSLELAEAFSRIATNRHSCRAFLAEPLPRGMIERMLDLAQRAPSDCNTQAWKTFILSGQPLEALRGQLSAHVASGGPTSFDLAPIERYDGTLLDRRRACGWALYDAVGIQKGDREASRQQAMENYRFFGAPHLAIITSDTSLGERGVFDAGIYMGYLVLAAESLGIAAVPQAAVSHYSDLLRSAAGIPDHLRIICALSFGRKDEKHPANGFRTNRADSPHYSVLIG